MESRYNNNKTVLTTRMRTISSHNLVSYDTLAKIVALLSSELNMMVSSASIEIATAV